MQLVHHVTAQPSGSQALPVGKIRGVDESDLIQHFDINQPARLMEPG
jgi:hypothetical protein